MKRLLIPLIVILFCSVCAGQEQMPAPPPEKNVDLLLNLPKQPHRLRPKVTLQEALEKAEDYVKKHKIDVSKYYLSSVTMFLYGAEDQKKEPMWQFLWMNETGAIGNYVTIIVSQNTGDVGQLPSM